MQANVIGEFSGGKWNDGSADDGCNHHAGAFAGERAKPLNAKVKIDGNMMELQMPTANSAYMAK